MWKQFTNIKTYEAFSFELRSHVATREKNAINLNDLNEYDLRSFVILELVFCWTQYLELVELIGRG